MRSTIEWRNSTLGVLTARCPWCRDLVTIERLDWLADVACPDCGRAMWPVSGETVAVFFRSDAGWNRRALLDLLARMPLTNVDSLFRVEATMLLEEVRGEGPTEEVLLGTADGLLKWLGRTEVSG
ncbi:MAG: hypothetical protein IT450_03640 [Phycisphaerales bacterium]|nr:hypothetical protein [Phycisphaerales bacterium]